MNILLAFIAFNVIVIVHELGHFIAAKKFGIKVLEFSLFIGPKLYSIQRGETTYSIRLFPIMAYVKMEGEEEASDSDRAFNNKPKYARALTAFCGPFANILLAILLITIVYSVQGFTTTSISKVERGSPAALAGIAGGDTLLSYDGKRVYTTLDVIQFLYISKGKPTEIEYIRNGEKLQKNISPGKTPERTTYKMLASFNSTGKDSNVIISIQAEGPAQKAGLTVGDRIIKINDANITSRDDVVAALDKSGGKEVGITALRNGAEVHVNLVPKPEKVPESYDLGIVFAGVNGGNIWDSFKQSFVYSYSIVRSVGYSLVWLFTGKVSLNQMMGPIGMVSTIGDVVQQAPNLVGKLFYLMNMTSLMSIAVGATNLVPFPMLDGNRLLLIGIEAIRRKPLKAEREAAISMVGFVLLIMLAIYVGFNDILRIFNK